MHAFISCLVSIFCKYPQMLVSKWVSEIYKCARFFGKCQIWAARREVPMGSKGCWKEVFRCQWKVSGQLQEYTAGGREGTIVAECLRSLLSWNFYSVSFIAWARRLKLWMLLCYSRHDFYTIIDLPEGEHQFKYYVDSEWLCDDKEVCIPPFYYPISEMWLKVCIFHTMLWWPYLNIAMLFVSSKCSDVAASCCKEFDVFHFSDVVQ